MKIKYYLRGLGIGILLTTVILGISFGTRSKSLSDEEIINKAEALGMVKEEETLPPKNHKESEEVFKPEEASKPKETSKSEESSKPQETTEMEAGENSALSETTETEKKENSASSEIPDTAEEDSKKAEEDNSDEITFTITSGMWSEDVSSILKSAGLIDDAVEFNTYLKNNGYQSKIQTGNYTIEKGADFKEIADKITKR